MAHSNKGYALVQLQEYEKAVESFDQAVKFISLDPKYECRKCETLIRRNLKSKQDFEIATDLNPKLAILHYNKGSALLNLKVFSKALQSLNQAIRISPNVSKFHAAKADLLYELQIYKDALESYEEAFRLDPDDARVKNRRDLIHKSISDRVEQNIQRSQV